MPRPALRQCQFLVTVVCLFASQVHAAPPALHRVLPWGERAGQVAIHEVPDGRYGPQALGACPGGEMLVLDTLGRQVLRLDAAGSLLDSARVARTGLDLAADESCGYTVLHPDELRRHGADGTELEVLRLPPEVRFVSGLRAGTDGRVVVEEGHSRSFELAWSAGHGAALQASIATIRAGVQAGGEMALAELENGSSARIVVLDRSGAAVRTIAVPFPEADLASVRLAGRDWAGRWVLDVERFVERAPVRVRRTVLGLGAKGSARWSLELPGEAYALTTRDLQLSADGSSLLAMLPAADGLHLLRWPLPDATAEPEALELPAALTRTAVPRSVEPEPFDEAFVQPQAAGPVIPRSEVLQRADAYVQHAWSAASCNIGTKTCGKTAVSPNWVSAGSHTRVAYQWGGFASISQYNTGLAGCKLAGDTNTTSGAASCAVGVDCSGFVSRAWNTTSKYGTATIHEVSSQIASSALQPGDVLNDAGSHVRMLVAHNANGTMNMVESYAGSDYWRVGYTVRTWSQNSGYVPRRYVNIVDDGGPRPGSWEDPIDISTASYSDSNTTAGAPADRFGSYSCAPQTDESGPEVVYVMELAQAATVTVSVSDGSGVDVDPHLLSGASSANCLARDDVSFSVPGVAPGQYYVVADTWVNSSGQQLVGPYQLSVRVQPSGALRAWRLAAPAEVQVQGRPLQQD